MTDALADFAEAVDRVMPGDGYGALERQVRADIAAMGTLTGGARASLAEMAYLLAAAIDRACLDPDVALTTVAGANKVLLGILREVSRTADDSSRRDALTKWLTAEMGNAAQPGPSDAGREGGGVGAGAGQAADAAPAQDR
jgi:hypothetical protein